jgi:hypothetical protein
MTPNCPRCGAPAVPGAAFCKSCGSSLVLSAEQPFTVKELLLGDIPTAFAASLGWGPVRIVFTDQRVLVLWTGPHQFLPSKHVYMEWKGALPPLPRTRLLDGTWVSGPEAPAWEFDNSAIIAIHVGKEHGLSPDPDVCDLSIEALSDGTRTTALGGMPLRRGSEGGVLWRVPGPVAPIEDFLRRMPIAAVVR